MEGSWERALGRRRDARCEEEGDEEGRRGREKAAMAMAMKLRISSSLCSQDLISSSRPMYVNTLLFFWNLLSLEPGILSLESGIF
jgi:hypothetical protein